jgi:hypothetical protein
MKKLTLIALLTVVTASFPGQCPAQGTFAPLFLFTSGSGSVTPLQNGQLLEVGQSYEMTAIPDSGSVFSSWQPANVFVFTYITFGPEGGPISTNTSVISSLVPNFIEQADLSFIMQAPQVVSDTPNLMITENSGWQANFEAIPEPSEAMLIAWCVAAVAFKRSFVQRSQLAKLNRASNSAGQQIDV